MASSASLVVKISADINDFTKQMDAMTRGVDRAAKRIESVGKAMTIGITAPVALAAAALGKMAAENEDTSARLQRVFGAMSTAVDASIKAMMKSVPATQTELQQLAISIDNMLQGMEIAPARAATMSEAMLKLAGDVAAFNHVPIGDALDALERGLAGKTKGLLQYGIAITEADIKQKAFALGILHSGNELTEAGKAQAAFALITERTTRIQGEAARTAEQQGKSFAFLKRDLKELADQVSALVLPSLSKLAKGAIEIVGALSTIPPEVTKTFFAFAAIAAIVGPALLALSKLAKGYIALKAAFTILSAGEGVAAFFAAISSPIGLVVTGVIALTAALGGLYLIWKKFQGNKDLTSALNTDKSLDAAIARQNAAGQKGGNTEFNPKAPLEQLQEQAGLVEKAFTRAIDNGTPLTRLFTQINSLHGQALALINAQGGALNKEAVGAREIADQMQRLQDIRTVINAGPGQLQNVINGVVNRPIDVGAQGAAGAVDAAMAYRLDLAKRLGQSSLPQTFNVGQEAIVKSRGLVQSTDQDLELRKALVGMSDGFNATKQAAVELAEEQRAASESTQLAFAKLISPLGSFGEHLAGLSIGMQNVIVNLANVIGAFAQNLASKISGSGPNAGLGGAIGGMLGPGLLALIPSIAMLTPLGIAVGTVGGTIAGGLIGGLFDHAKASTDNASDSLDMLAKTADRVSASISNIPQFFKVELERFRAAPITPPPSPPTPPPPPIINPIFQGKTPTPSGNVVPSTTFNIQTLNVTSSASSMKDLMKDVYAEAAKQKATGSRAPFVFSPNAAFAG
jgi:hypothetical protein